MDRHHHVLLLVEDHDATRRTLARLLGLKGWDVRTAATIAQGLAQLDSGPECVVLDLMLPDGDGEEILRHVREAGLPIRVAVTTAAGDEARLRDALALGADALIRKPIDFEALCRACDPA